MYTTYLLVQGEELNYGQKDMVKIKKYILAILVANMEIIDTDQ